MGFPSLLPMQHLEDRTSVMSQWWSVWSAQGVEVAAPAVIKGLLVHVMPLQQTTSATAKPSRRFIWAQVTRRRTLHNTILVLDKARSLARTGRLSCPLEQGKGIADSLCRALGMRQGELTGNGSRFEPSNHNRLVKVFSLRKALSSTQLFLLSLLHGGTDAFLCSLISVVPPSYRLTLPNNIITLSFDARNVVRDIETTQTISFTLFRSTGPGFDPPNKGRRTIAMLPHCNHRSIEIWLAVPAAEVFALSCANRWVLHCPSFRIDEIGAVLLRPAFHQMYA